MATTASRVRDDQGLQPFYVLRIHGLPYNFCGTVNPYESKWGSSAWTLGTGYSSVPGLDLPDDKLEQQIQDLVGGTATAERLRATVKDAKQGNGTWIFGRIFATGRALTDTSVLKGTLEEDLPATAGEDDTFDVRTPDTFPSEGALCIGSETLLYSAVSVSSGISTFTIRSRNEYPCAPTFPPTPYYRIFRSADGVILPDRNVIVTGNASGTPEPMTIVGRYASLTMGHVRPQGTALEAEDQALIRMLGRIVGLKYKGGRFELEIESVTADLSSDALRVAPDLARAQISNQIILSDTHWQSFVVGLQKADATTGAVRLAEKTITVSSSYAGPSALEQLIAAINAQLLAVKSALATSVQLAYCRLQSGESRLCFKGRAPDFGALGLNYRFYVRHGLDSTSVGAEPGRGRGSLLSALGFTDDATEFVADDPGTFEGAGIEGELQYVVAGGPPPSVFIPTASQGANTFTVIEGIKESARPGARFFTDQGDDSGRAWVRFGNGDIVELTGQTNTTLTTGNRVAPLHGDYPPDPQIYRTFYSVPKGAVGSVEQIVITPDSRATSPAGPVLTAARILASTTANAADDINVYPEGVGLGFDGLLDKSSWREEQTGAGRRWLIDAATTFAEIWRPIAKEYGLFLVWDPAVGQVAFRRIRMPQASIAETYQFTEANRHAAAELTDTVSDQTHIRTGWTLEWGWSEAEKKRLGEISYTEQFARTVFGADTKHEKIQDKSLTRADAAAKILAQIAGRSVYYRYPWIRCRRTLNKTGLLLAPGTFHKIIDATIHNPFTGVLGIVDSDNIYGFLTRVGANLAAADNDAPVEVEFLINGLDPHLQFRTWSPTAYVDRASGTNGYTAGSKTLYLKRWYTNNSDASKKDGIDFAAGYKVRVITMDNDGAPTYSDDTIVSVATDGASVVLTTGLSGGLQTAMVSLEAMMIFQPYTSATAVQEAAVSWKGSAVDGLIQSAARNTKWS